MVKRISCAVVLVAWFPAVARAGDGASRVELGGVAGVGTPDGLLGLEIEAAIDRGLALAGGAGFAASSGAVSIQPRLFGTDDLTGFYAGAGLSLSGEHFHCAGGDLCLDPHEDGTAAWANMELGYEAHLGGMFVRGFFGFSVMLNSRSVCYDPDPSTCQDEVPYAGIAIGADLSGEGTPAPSAPDAPAAVHDAQLRELTDEARDAVLRSRCDVARQIDAEVARLDRAYHDQVFVADGAIAACLER